MKTEFPLKHSLKQVVQLTACNRSRIFSRGRDGNYRDRRIHSQVQLSAAARN